MKTKRIELLKKISIADKCIYQLARILKLVVHNGEFSYDGTTLSWCDCVVYDFHHNVTLPSGIIIDGLLLFGDGTFEIREFNDANNYSQYSNEDLAYIENLLTNKK